MVRNNKSVAVSWWYRSSAQPYPQLCTKSYLKSNVLSFSRGYWLIHCELTWIIFNIRSVTENGVFHVTPDTCNVADSGCGVLQSEVTWHVDTMKCCCLRHSEVWSWPFCNEQACTHLVLHSHDAAPDSLISKTCWMMSPGNGRACCLTCRMCCLCVIMSGCLQPSAVIFLALFSSSFTSWGTCFCVPLGVPCLSSGCRMQITDSHCYLTCWRRFPCNTHSTYSTSVNLLWDVLNRETICLNDSNVWNSLNLYLHKSCFLLCTFYVTFIQPRLNDVDC